MDEDAARAQAQQLFQVKEMDYNPRRPFYLTLGALALVGLIYGGYVWWQMQPKQNFALAQAQPRPIVTPAQPAVPPAPAVAGPPGRFWTGHMNEGSRAGGPRCTSGGRDYRAISAHLSLISAALHGPPSRATPEVSAIL